MTIGEGVRIIVLIMLLNGAIAWTKLAHEFGVHQGRVRTAVVFASGVGLFTAGFVVVLEQWHP